jgi:mono/diheme cytochrome c family protein
MRELVEVTARPRHLGWLVAGGLLLLALVGVAVVAWMNVRGELTILEDDRPRSGTEQQIARGAYLARAGDCAACHTDRGGAAYAGGKGIETPFGTVYASNLTPDPASGIGNWSPAHFWRALHNGRSKDGRLLYPAFPYPNYTYVTREDSDAIYAFLRTQAPVNQPNRRHALHFPYGLQASLAIWRALYFEPGTFAPNPNKPADWNRGAYLVSGLGHCAACHSPRNLLGATVESTEFEGGMIPMQNWYAPSLGTTREAWGAEWDLQDVVDFLKTGKSRRGTAMGPMAAVVFESTQHLSDSDLRAIAAYFMALPRTGSTPRPDAAVMAQGAALYKDNCAACHGEQGEGRGDYPSLVRNRTATMKSPVNMVRIIFSGGFPPATAGNPRPYGMPPFGQTLSDAEIAAVATYVRNSWGNEAPPISQVDMLHLR